MSYRGVSPQNSMHRSPSYKSQGGDSAAPRGQESRSPTHRDRPTNERPGYEKSSSSFNNRRDTAEESSSPSKSYLSRFTANDEPILGENPEWVRKSSRQRRFTQTTLPSLHQREAIAKEEVNYDETEREQALGEMSEHMNDMSGYVTGVVLKKEEDLKHMAEMFDEEGNPIMRYDEDGNPIPFRDEDGYELDGWYEEDNKKPSMVTIETTKMSIKEGWLWKKGAGDGLFSRTNWTRRYFKFDMSQVTKIFYYKTEMQNCSPQREAETKEMYGKRKKKFNSEQQKQSRGFVHLMYATMNIPGVRRHRNPSINPSWVFEVAVPRRTFQLCAESQEEFDMWTQTIGYITETIKKARESMNKKRVPRSLYDEGKRDAALCCTAFGKGLFESVAGQSSEFTVQGFDFENGIPATQGGLKIAAVLESRDLHYDLPVVDNGDGTYTITYTPTRVGTYELTVMLEDYDIKGSPFHPHVRPAPVSAPHCVADGAGLYCAVIGAVNRFNIHTRNSFNQIVVAKGVPFQVHLLPPLSLCRLDGTRLSPGEEWRPHDNGNGTYSVAYVVNADAKLMDKLNRGDHSEGEIHVELDDRIYNPSFSRSIKGGPFRPVMAASATGAALATAARHAALMMGGREYHDMINSFSLGASLSNGQSEMQSTPQLQPMQARRPPAMESFISDGGDVMEVEDVEEDEDFGEASSYHMRELRPSPSQQRSRIMPQQHYQEKRRFDESFSNGAPSGGRQQHNSYVSDPSTSKATSSPSSYLPIRRRRSDPDVLGELRSIPNGFDGLSLEQRQALDAEREQLLRLRKELHDGKHLVEEQMGRIALAGHQRQNNNNRTSEEKERHMEAPPPQAPYQYSRSSPAVQRPPTRSPPSHPGSSQQQQQPPVQQQRSSSTQPTVLAPLRVFDSSVTSLFNKHVQPLKRVFRHYMSRDEFSRLDSVSLPMFLKCCTDFDITPTFASKKEIREAFEQAKSLQQQRGADAGLDFSGFVEALGLVAVNSLGKPMFAHLYQTPQSRVSVLLGMWGLGDPATFEAVVQREKYVKANGETGSRRPMATEGQYY